ncbi:MAG TPA: COX15/CtaA family protein [Gemmatimonadales bacterium]|nr:COX15/CtaA family protein [Gemmatimonadales bacterium]
MRFRRFAWGVLGGNLFVILWGAFVRASGSGAGCGRHWPLCNGVALPSRPSTATLIELTHRISSGLALALVVLLFWWARREFPRGHRVRHSAGWALLFICSEALIGAGLVLLALVGRNDSLARAGYLAAHLCNTFLLLGSVALTAHWAAPNPQLQPPPAPAVRWGLAAGLALLLLVGMSGAVTALGDTLFPAASLNAAFRADRAAASHWLIRLRVLHPAIAVLTGLYLVGMIGVVGRTRPAVRDSGWGRAVLLLVLTQLSLGIANLLLLAPTALQLAHLLVADVLWIAVVVFAASALERGRQPERSAAIREIASAAGAASQ